ncbi:hypothetical protein [Chengkuizengella axinellae]|uniref:Uncharacterized protein n=1 Tax=Chengkuizengella axinellae TaxID=3064388 RepID=A0ABT9J564_9BACL|nr:hypothetical protein [Chengkuizengella sp. 2205SS18-9]MDP5276708.1 hypothetical protein [Chengkuizengella sp. 2205SS18-9]
MQKGFKDFRRNVVINNLVQKYGGNPLPLNGENRWKLWVEFSKPFGILH